MNGDAGVGRDGLIGSAADIAQEDAQVERGEFLFDDAAAVPVIFLHEQTVFRIDGFIRAAQNIHQGVVPATAGDRVVQRIRLI